MTIVRPGPSPAAARPPSPSRRGRDEAHRLRRLSAALRGGCRTKPSRKRHGARAERARQRSHARRPRNGQPARGGRDARFRSPPLEAVWRARRGFVRQPPRVAQASAPCVRAVSGTPPGCRSDVGRSRCRRGVASGDSGIAERGSGGVPRTRGRPRAVPGPVRGFHDFRIEFAEIRDLGDRIIGIGRWSTCGEESGVESTQPLAVVADLKNGKTIHVRTYFDPKDALEAVGLRE